MVLMNEYLKAPKGQIVKSRTQYCSHYFLKIAFSFTGASLSAPMTRVFASGPHWEHSPQTPTIGSHYRACHDSGL